MLEQRQVDSALECARGYVASGHLPMVAVSASDGRGLRARVGYDQDGSERDEFCDGVYALASISKAITGVLVARLYEQGVLDYNTPIVDYIPEFGTNEARRGIKLGQIFTHSTGLQSRFVDSCHEVEYDPARLLALLCTEELVDEPGTHSRYSTHTYQLINAAIQRRLGLSMEAALQQVVCEPCGMTGTSFYPDPARAMPVVDHPVAEGPQFTAIQRMEMSGGGLWSTLDDLQALGRAWLTPGRLVQPETFALVTALQPGLPLAGDEKTLSRRTLGFNRERPASFPLQPESGFCHGGATGTLWYMDPDQDLVFVLLTNRWSSGNDHAFAALNCLYE